MRNFSIDTHIHRLAARCLSNDTTVVRSKRFEGVFPRHLGINFIFKLYSLDVNIALLGTTTCQHAQSAHGLRQKRESLKKRSVRLKNSDAARCNVHENEYSDDDCGDTHRSVFLFLIV